MSFGPLLNFNDVADKHSQKKLDAPPTVVGSNMSVLRPVPPRSRTKNGTRKTGDVCLDPLLFLFCYFPSSDLEYP